MNIEFSHLSCFAFNRNLNIGKCQAIFNGCKMTWVKIQVIRNVEHFSGTIRKYFIRHHNKLHWKHMNTIDKSL